METTNPLAGLLGKSPFKPIQRHMRKVAECADQVPLLVAALVKGDAPQLQSIAERISALENEADALENDIFLHLPKSLFMPVDRRDLLAILDLNDDVADHCEHLAITLVSHDHAPPAGLGEAFLGAVNLCVAVVRVMGGIIEKLDELVETGFSGREAEQVIRMLSELSEAKDGATRAVIQVTRSLYKDEGSLSPVQAVYWSRVMDDVGEIAHCAEKAGNHIRLLLAR
ncbi:MAG: TIGR00153 family protein [Magnetococcales bacterium]|nr:TIGR00153 family protein [Magnetococcales bacterium]